MGFGACVEGVVFVRETALRTQVRMIALTLKFCSPWECRDLDGVHTLCRTSGSGQSRNVSLPGLGVP